MPDSEDKPKWERTNRALQKQESQRDLPLNPDRPMEVPGALQGPANAVAKPDGIVANFKANKITRRAALEHLEVWYNAQLDVAKHRLAEVARVRKAEASLIAEQFLQSLDSQHLEFLIDLGLRNEATRHKAFKALGDQTAQTLKELEGRDWPEKLLEETIQGVIDRHRKFFAKIIQDLGEARSGK